VSIASYVLHCFVMVLPICGCLSIAFWLVCGFVAFFPLLFLVCFYSVVNSIFMKVNIKSISSHLESQSIVL